MAAVSCSASGDQCKTYTKCGHIYKLDLIYQRISKYMIIVIQLFQYTHTQIYIYI